jgi:hypothetical protein
LVEDCWAANEPNNIGPEFVSLVLGGLNEPLLAIIISTQFSGECMGAAISKILHNVIATYSKTPMGQFESDATACFDCIVMMFAMFCFFRIWLPIASDPVLARCIDPPSSSSQDQDKVPLAALAAVCYPLRSFFIPSTALHTACNSVTPPKCACTSIKQRCLLMTIPVPRTSSTNDFTFRPTPKKLSRTSR